MYFYFNVYRLPSWMLVQGFIYKCTQMCCLSGVLVLYEPKVCFYTFFVLREIEHVFQGRVPYMIF